ncbi:hypothetical protein DES53_106145 [Roseimicrobium gellanilyticum]|uniref:Uncharacterized protein n=1 Tax=Roseimicrobium gellanilyticum TaxID=748857 RepID=A0A366HI41_9BACT|nr:hypothetical protein [Roseimicrobium gellanilyticum]RBP42438.1 hypothetical protein DES53_106145 [Roseimicrobium gellanilyticum]
MIFPTPTAQDQAALHWTKQVDPCENCCGPWLGSVLIASRRAALDTDPEISLGADQPAYECVVDIELGGCGEENPSCEEGFEDAVEVATSERDDAQVIFDDKTLEQELLSEAVGDRNTEADSALAEMQSARIAYSQLQNAHTSARIKEETFTRRNDPAGVAAALAEQAAIQSQLSDHIYHDKNNLYITARTNVGDAYAEFYEGQRQLDLIQRDLDVAIYKLACAEHNLSVATGEDVEMWFVSGRDGTIAHLTADERRDGFYRLEFDMAERSGEDGISQRIPLPSGTTNIRFEWREVFIPADGSEYIYGEEPFTEDVEVESGTQVARTADHYIAAPEIEGTYRIVTMPGRAQVSIVSEDLHASKVKYGFPAYIHTGTTAQWYATETASGLNTETGVSFSGSQSVDEFFNIESSLSASVTAHPERVSGVGGNPFGSKSRQYTATQRQWPDGMVMTLSGLVSTDSITQPVDSHLDSAWGTPLPENLAPSTMTNPHRRLFIGETAYSRLRRRFKLQVTIPSNRPFPVTIEVKYDKKTYTYATNSWVVEEESHEVTILTGETTAIEDEWTEIDPMDGTIVVMANVRAEPHLHLWHLGVDVSIAPHED